MTKPAKQQPNRNDGPTKERKAKGDTVYAGLGKSDRVYSAVTPLDRMLKAGWIDRPMHEAGKRYARHVYESGIAGVPKSANLDGAAGGGDCTYGMAANEHQAFHRQEYRKAVQAVGSWRCAAFQLFVCHDCPLEEVGYRMGETNKKQAVAAAREMIKGKLFTLAVLWGLKMDNAA